MSLVQRDLVLYPVSLTETHEGDYVTGDVLLPLITLLASPEPSAERHHAGTAVIDLLPSVDNLIRCVGRKRVAVA